MGAWAVFLPLLGSFVAGVFGKPLGDRSARLFTILCMVLATLAAETELYRVLVTHQETGYPIARWFALDSFAVDWKLRFDTLSAVMVGMVTFVSTFIHIYSVGYMAHEPRRVARFFSYLSLFTFAMLMLVTADNLVQLFFGWEGVGLASYLLIGYWYEKPSACAAAIKAFVVNRVGDLFFAVGIALLFYVFGSVSFSDIFAHVADHAADRFTLFGTPHHALEIIALLLFIGATGKSAQLGLHVWLPDAMEGPTPVSALIHAATMVTAGVFLMARMSPLLSVTPVTLAIITLVGGATAFFAATVGCVQNDIKRVIAYSTCSQLGYMFVAAGVDVYQASIFHLITHAFFKALLFLGAGSVIHALSDEQDIRRMGGLWRKIPFTYAVMWIGSLALAGIFPFAGFYSKDAIIEAAYAHGGFAGMWGYVCGVAAAFLTAFYSWRLLFLVFHGPSRVDPKVAPHIHESPLVMTVPLAVLAVGAVAAGFMLRGAFIGGNPARFWAGSIVNGEAGRAALEGMEHLPGLISLLPTVVALLGIGLAYVMYQLVPSLPEALARAFPPLYRFLLNKWYFDEIYDFLLVRPAMGLARLLWQVGDLTIIDGVPNGLASLVDDSSGQVSRLQTGSVAIYAFSMLIGLVLLVTLYLFLR